MSKRADASNNAPSSRKKRRTLDVLAPSMQKEVLYAYEAFEELSLKTLMGKQEDDFQLTSENASTHTNDSDHATAEALQVEIPYLLSPDIDKMEEEDPWAYVRFQSHLVARFSTYDRRSKTRKKIKVAFGTEADICSIFSEAANDAISIHELEGTFEGGELEIKYERSLFGCRPDIMVVRGKDGVGLLAVEMKKPSPVSLREYGYVLGHAFDHAMAMKAFHVGTDLVLLSSFEETFLCSLKRSDLTLPQQDEMEGAPGNSSQPEPAAGMEHDRLLETDGLSQPAPPVRQEDGETEQGTDHLLSRLGTPIMSQSQSPPIMKSPGLRELLPTVSKDCSSDSSPQAGSSSPGSSSTDSASPASSSSSGSLSADRSTSLSPIKKCSSSGLFTKGTTPRKLYMSSEGYKAHELVNLIYTSLIIAKDDYIKFKKTIYRLHTGSSYHFSKVLRVVAGTRKADWGQLDATVGKPIMEGVPKKNPTRSEDATAPKRSEKSYYIVGSLGKGITSNVFQALDSSGRLVALKIYVKNIDGNGNVLKKEDFDKVAEAAIEVEKTNLLKFYPFLKDRVKAVKVCGYCGLVMPIFEPVQERWDNLDEIEKILGRFADQGKKYRRDDIRWRHVGMFTDNEGADKEGVTHCVLYDLADLADLEAGDEDIAKAHRNIFEVRINGEVPKNDGGLFSQAEELSE